MLCQYTVGNINLFTIGILDTNQYTMVLAGFTNLCNIKNNWFVSFECTCILLKQVLLKTQYSIGTGNKHITTAVLYIYQLLLLVIDVL